MMLPGRMAMWLAAGVSLLLLATALVTHSAAGKWLLLIAVAIDVLLALAMTLDGLLLRRTHIVVSPQFPKRGEAGREIQIVWCIENRSNGPVYVTLEFTDQSDGLSAISPDRAAERLLPSSGQWLLQPRQAIQAAFHMMPADRGLLHLPRPVLTKAHPWRLAQFRIAGPKPPPITIYPSIAPIRRYEALRRNRALNQIGMHQRRLVGSGREFEQLRDYLPDDEFRDINWKASAHHRKLITNVFQMERSQDVLLCLDAARMMAMPVSERTALDFAIDAAILLAYTVARQGDRVGLAVFRDQMETFIKPAGSTRAVSRVIKAMVEVQPKNLFPSYAALAEAVRTRQNRRAMIFLFTDMNDPQLTTNLSEIAGSLRRRHLLTVISLRDPLLNQAVGSAPRTATEMFQVMAARQLLLQRDSHKTKLKLAGAGLLESDAGGLSIAVINRYLTIKARQLA